MTCKGLKRRKRKQPNNQPTFTFINYAVLCMRQFKK